MIKLINMGLDMDITILVVHLHGLLGNRSPHSLADICVRADTEAGQGGGDLFST